MSYGPAMRKGLAVLAVALAFLATADSAAARPGVVSVTLKRAASPGDGPVLVLRTKGVRSHTGAVLAFQTSRSFADAVETRPTRWIISRQTRGGSRLLSRLQTDMREQRRARLNAGVAAHTAGGGRVSAFTLVAYGVTAPSHQLPG